MASAPGVMDCTASPQVTLSVVHALDGEDAHVVHHEHANGAMEDGVMLHAAALATPAASNGSAHDVEAANSEDASHIAASVTLHRITVHSAPTLAQRFTAAFPAAAKNIESFFSTPEEDPRSPAQQEREKYVLWAPWSGKFQRWMIIAPSMLVNFAVGSLYSWSIFNSGMDALWGSVGANSHAFTIAIAAEGVGTLLLGNYIERAGPFTCVSYATVMAPLAWAFACLGAWKVQIGVVYALFGVPLGIAGAFGFVATVANMQRWFPDNKGLAAGVTVSAFGIGAFMWQLIGNAFMDVNGPWRFAPWQVMGIFSAIFAGAMLLSLPFMRAPPPGFAPPPHADDKNASLAMRALKCLFPTSKPTPPDRPYTYLQAVMQLEFILICISMFGALMAGVVFLSSAADMTKYVFNKDSSYANVIAAMLNVMNFTGRIIWGIVAERIGRRPFFIVAGVAQACALGLMALWIHLGIFELWLLSFFVVGSLYGGSHGVLPSFLNQMFGSKIAGALHGTLLFVWACADVVGVPIFQEVLASNTMKLPSGKSVGAPGAYMINCYWLCAMPLMSAIVMAFVDTKAVDRTLRKAFHECRVRCFHTVCIVKCLTPEEQERELAAYKDAMSVLHRQTSKRDASAAAAAATHSSRSHAPSLSLVAIPGVVDLYAGAAKVEGDAARDAC